MIKLKATRNGQVRPGDFGIEIEGAEIGVPPALLERLRAMDVVSGEALYAILQDYPEALAMGQQQPVDVASAASKALARIRWIIPRELREAGAVDQSLFQYGALFPYD
ncbi:hypothetical protein [Xanthomonas arboricola]|nr:hypothetical protein [Xanthomonas arboricola]MDN0267217.1 hypothetical protein [Xanthomonas arboricola pv. pruni]MDN0276824.1 hypothetical protein [Xanthomonas arboricola pv. pruni]MDN0282063.1 hypothetical protein [Xanthomonas arboricola pv. pruni]MDN0289122.1 hypothetical protein [Xanthomonas arboricola pv. pruni]MDN0293279.1 hypothetical protein [Xanthomonas arboricola pv. pruni]